MADPAPQTTDAELDEMQRWVNRLIDALDADPCLAEEPSGKRFFERVEEIQS